MDFKKLIADLAARYRKLTEPISSSSLAPPGQVVDVDAAHEAGRKAGYEAGYKKGYDEGLQVGLEAKTLPEPSGPKSQSQPPSESPPPSLSLYERLGGVYSIATVIDDFIDRVMIDPRLNANPRVDEAHHRVPPAGFKYLVTEMLCWASGGPQKYTGRAMKESHQHLMITAAEWEAFLDDLQQTLDKFAVPEAERQFKAAASYGGSTLTATGKGTWLGTAASTGPFSFIRSTPITIGKANSVETTSPMGSSGRTSPSTACLTRRSASATVTGSAALCSK
jgi:hemoglobin